jgi:U3 small nucleolar RNA-associated protein 11
MAGESSLRNAVKRVAHKERAQPSHRKKLGFLEKHKDYVIRAKDFKKKKTYVQTLKKKANNKNPDEFYLHMNNSKVVNGIHSETSAKALNVKVASKLKTQDLGYFMYRKSVVDSRMRKLSERLQLVGVLSKSEAKHTFFVEPDSNLLTLDQSKSLDTDARLLDEPANRIRKSSIDKFLVVNKEDMLLTSDFSKIDQAKRDRRKSALCQELLDSVDNSEQLTNEISQLMLQRNLMKKGSKEKQVINDGECNVYKWKRQRSK